MPEPGNQPCQKQVARISKFIPWFKKKEPPAGVKAEPERELTGIEKHEQEMAMLDIANALKEREERVKVIQLRISELEREIGPQMQELYSLRGEIAPWSYHAFRMQQDAISSQQAVGYQGGYLGGALGGILGGI